MGMDRFIFLMLMFTVIVFSIIEVFISIKIKRLKNETFKLHQKYQLEKRGKENLKKFLINKKGKQ